MNSRRQKQSLYLLTAAILAALSLAEPAQAYYWNSYGTRFFGTNLLYSIPYLASPLLGLNRGPYNANPVYSVSSYLRRSGQRAVTAPLVYQPYYLQNYKDDEPIYDPRDRYRPIKPQNYGQDIVSHATWKGSGATNPNPGVNSNPAGYDPFYAPIPNNGSSKTAPPIAPPVAPPINNQRALSAPYSTPNKVPHSPFNIRTPKKKAGAQPIADGFVSTVVEQFDGDFQSALGDPATRSWAKALGIINDDQITKAEFTPTRIHLIRQILLDPSLNSVSKLDAIKILLPASANRATR